MTTIRSRSRLVAAGALALALSGAVVPSVAWAQDGPDAPVRGLLQAIAEKRFDETAQFFCPEFAGEAAQMDLSAALAANLPEGVDPELAAGAFTLTVTGPGGEGEAVVTVLDGSPEGQQVSVEGTLGMDVDPEGAEALLRAIAIAQLEALGTEVSEEAITAAMDLGRGQMEALGEFSVPISLVVVVTQTADGTWLICSALEEASASPSPGASAGPAAVVEPAASATAAPA